MDKRRSPMTFDEFKKYMDAIEHDDNASEEISRATHGCIQLFELYQSTGKLIDLLSYVFHDDSDWIGYYCFELDHGKKYRDGMITDGNKKNIRLSNTQELYEVLIEDFNSSLH